MNNTKYELNSYSFYDTEGLARHFERMAAAGWVPDREGLFLRYRRIAPQKLRFAVTYYPDDSDETPAELYDEDFRATIYHDALPLSLSDLSVEDGNARWSCMSWQRSSPFAAQYGGQQDDVLARFSDPEHPETARGNPAQIYYTVSDVYLSGIFERCLAAELDYHQTVQGADGACHELPYAYRETDAAPWGAERAWRLYNEYAGEWLDEWLLVRGTRIVDFISVDVEMGGAQMAAVGEKLLNN